MTKKKKVKEESFSFNDFDEIKKQPQCGIVNIKALYVRKGAGKDFDSVDVIYENTKVQIDDIIMNADNQKWYKITYDNKEGYIDSTYVNIIE